MFWNSDLQETVKLTNGALTNGLIHVMCCHNKPSGLSLCREDEWTKLQQQACAGLYGQTVTKYELTSIC